MEVRQIRPEDIPEIAEVERIAWGANAAPEAVIARRAAVFAPGSIVVHEAHRILGYAAAQLTDRISIHSWAEQTDDGRIAATHVPGGQLAYGVSMSARPGIGGKGVAHHVIAHYARLFLGRGCRALCVGSRLPGYARWAGTVARPSLAAYMARGADGMPRDPEMRLYAANGFRLLWEMPGYYPDAESGGHGAMMLRTEP